MQGIWTRFNSLMLALVFLALVAVIAMLARDAYGGPLDPPPGPVASTNGVRLPGTPISSLPFTITDPGNYYVTQYLQGNGGEDGITVLVDDVTIDLMGFTLDGSDFFSDGLNGIKVQAPVASDPLRHITIRNGTLRYWSQWGISAPTAIFSRFEDLTLSNNGTSIAEGGLRAGSANIIERVIAHENVGTGIQLDQVGPWAGGHLTDSLVTHNFHGLLLYAAQVIVEGNTFNSNSGVGIGVNGPDNVIRGNETDWNNNGIWVTSGVFGNEISRHRAEHNTTSDCRDSNAFSTANDWGPISGNADASVGLNEWTGWVSPFDAMMNICVVSSSAP